MSEKRSQTLSEMKYNFLQLRPVEAKFIRYLHLPSGTEMFMVEVPSGAYACSKAMYLEASTKLSNKALRQRWFEVCEEDPTSMQNYDMMPIRFRRVMSLDTMGDELMDAYFDLEGK